MSILQHQYNGQVTHRVTVDQETESSVGGERGASRNERGPRCTAIRRLVKGPLVRRAGSDDPSGLGISKTHVDDRVAELDLRRDLLNIYSRILRDVELVGGIEDHFTRGRRFQNAVAFECSR